MKRILEWVVRVYVMVCCGRTHALATDDICQPTEKELTNEGANGGGDLETKILIRSGLLARTVDITDHDGGDVDGEDIITKDRGCIVKREERRSKGRTNASVKKPTPAIKATLT